MKILRSLFVVMLCGVGWNLRGEDSFSLETTPTQDPFGLIGDKSSGLISSDSGTNPLGLGPALPGDSSPVIDALSSGDGLNSYASGDSSLKSEEPSVFDSSIFREGVGTGGPELGQKLWGFEFEKTSTGSFESERPNREDLTLFTEKKKEPLKINPLWQEDKSPAKQENSDMPWGWSLGPQAPKEQPKKGFLDW